MQVGTPFEILFQDVGEEWYIEDRTQTPSSELSRRESRKPSMGRYRRGGPLPGQARILFAIEATD
jgi:hypothetical protein